MSKSVRPCVQAKIFCKYASCVQCVQQAPIQVRIAIDDNELMGRQQSYPCEVCAIHATMQCRHENVIVGSRDIGRVGNQTACWPLLHALEETAVVHLHSIVCELSSTCTSLYTQDCIYILWLVKSSNGSMHRSSVSQQPQQV